MPLVAGKTPGRNRALEPDPGDRPSCSLFSSLGIIMHTFFLYPYDSQPMLERKRKRVCRIEEEPALSSSIAETLLLFRPVGSFLDFSHGVNSIYLSSQLNYCTVQVKGSGIWSLYTRRVMPHYV